MTGPGKLLNVDKDVDATLGGILNVHQNTLIVGIDNSLGMNEANEYLFFEILPKLAIHGLAEKRKVPGKQWEHFELNETGREVLRVMELRELEAEKIKPAVPADSGAAQERSEPHSVDQRPSQANDPAGVGQKQRKERPKK